MFPKLQKVSTTSSPGITRQDTIEEIVEIETPHRSSLGLRKMQSYDCGLRDPTAISLYQTPVPDPIIAPPEYKELMTNIMDFKVDVKLEIQRLNQKMSKMEELLSEVLNKLNTNAAGHSSSSQVSCFSCNLFLIIKCFCSLQKVINLRRNRDTSLPTQLINQNDQRNYQRDLVRHLQILKVQVQV